jgi:hypothetical protein
MRRRAVAGATAYFPVNSWFHDAGLEFPAGP